MPQERLAIASIPCRNYNNFISDVGDTQAMQVTPTQAHLAERDTWGLLVITLRRGLGHVAVVGRLVCEGRAQRGHDRCGRQLDGDGVVRICICEDVSGLFVAGGRVGVGVGGGFVLKGGPADMALCAAWATCDAGSVAFWIGTQAIVLHSDAVSLQHAPGAWCFTLAGQCSAHCCCSSCTAWGQGRTAGLAAIAQKVSKREAHKLVVAQQRSRRGCCGGFHDSIKVGPLQAQASHVRMRSERSRALECAAKCKHACAQVRMLSQTGGFDLQPWAAILSAHDRCIERVPDTAATEMCPQVAAPQVQHQMEGATSRWSMHCCSLAHVPQVHTCCRVCVAVVKQSTMSLVPKSAAGAPPL